MVSLDFGTLNFLQQEKYLRKLIHIEKLIFAFSTNQTEKFVDSLRTQISSFFNLNANVIFIISPMQQFIHKWYTMIHAEDRVLMLFLKKSNPPGTHRILSSVQIQFRYEKSIDRILKSPIRLLDLFFFFFGFHLQSLQKGGHFRKL